MKYDCTKAKDFFHEITRLKEWCRDKSSCGTCGLKPPCPLCCAPSVYDWGGLSDDVFTNLIGILQEWSDSHPERRDLTEDEVTVLKALLIIGVNYITRDRDGTIRTYIDKPRKINSYWFISKGSSPGYPIPNGNLFNGILSFDDEEPAEIEELLK